jgi:hypothetical protein
MGFSENVQAGQQALIDLGYDLPRFGADGWWGGETEAALDDFCVDHGTAEPSNQYAIDEALVLVHRVAGSVAALPDFPGVDCRALANPKKVAGQRSWTEIDSLLFHQTAVVFGGEKIRRIAGLAINGAVTVHGQALRIHDPDVWCWHAQGFSERSIGIEIEGYFAGVEGDDETFWRPPSRPNRQPMALKPEMITAAIALGDWYVALVEAHGGKITKLLTHRQAYPSKPSDPGEAIYKAICLPLMERHDLGGAEEYRAAYSYTKRGERVDVRPGRPVPHEWKPDMPTGYRHQPKNGGVDKRGKAV